MKQTPKESSFASTVEQALKHFQDPQWLGQNSPLASPYFLGDWLSSKAIHADARGRTLQELLRDACAKISGRYQDRYRTILREYYFQERALDVVCDQVGLGRNSFHLSRNEAIRSLAEIIAIQINPALRLETPPKSQNILERETQLAQCVEILNRSQTVVLTGSGGIGKTTLGGAIAAKCKRPIFWLTVRPGINDSLEAFLFALGSFLHAHGSSALWLESVATADKFKPDRMLGIARYALEQLNPKQPLLCIDEADLLTPSDDANHGLIVKFLESLRGITPLLLIGQRPLLDANLFCPLEGLSPKSIQQLFTLEKIALSVAQLQEIHATTQGNPRILELLIALHRSGHALEETLHELSSQPALEFLLSRILQRLDQPACAALMELSVFRRPAPASLWLEESNPEILNQIVELHLAQYDQQGGVSLLPAYRSIIYHLLPDEKRQALHANAAALRTDYADYAAAVYHLIQSGQVEQSIWLWYNHRQQAINQGQAQSALTLLNNIRSMPLSALARETLDLSCAELERLTGNAAKAQMDIHSILWQTPILSIDANYLAGVIANDQSEFEKAEVAFREALKTAEKIVELRITHLHRGLGARHLAERNIDGAIYEAQRARYEVENFEGDIQLEIGNYALAENHYTAAIQIAEQIDHLEGIAKTSTTLAWIAIMRGESSKLMQHLTRAEECYKHLGKVTQAISLQISWAVAHNLAGNHEKAIHAAQDAQRRLAQIGGLSPRLQALTAQALSESYLGQGNLQQATEFVGQVLATEELSTMPDAYLTYGIVLRNQARIAESFQFIRNALQLATENEDRFLQGYGWRELGITHAVAGSNDDAQTAFANAIALFEKMGLQNEVEKTQKSAGLA